MIFEISGSLEPDSNDCQYEIERNKDGSMSITVEQYGSRVTICGEAFDHLSMRVAKFRDAQSILEEKINAE